MNLKSCLLATALWATLASPASANIVFQASSGNPSNLEVVNTSDIVFTATSAYTYSFLDVHLVDVWTADQPTGFVFGSTTAPLTINGPFTSTQAGVAGITLFGTPDGNDLVLTWGFGEYRSVAIGDEIVFGAGVYTLPNFLINRIVPNTTADQIAAVFNTDANQPLSGPVFVNVGENVSEVPEPATISLALLSLAGLAGLRRRTDSSARKTVTTR